MPGLTDITTELEQVCIQILAALAEENWDQVRELDSHRKILVEQFSTLASGAPEQLDVTRQTNVLPRILKLDQKIQQQIYNAWQKARNDLLSMQNAQPGIEMYHQQEPR